MGPSWPINGAAGQRRGIAPEPEKYLSRHPLSPQEHIMPKLLSLRAYAKHRGVNRISAELVGITDQPTMHSVLLRELNIALQELCGHLDSGGDNRSPPENPHL